jgi:hypothetical protein
MPAIAGQWIAIQTKDGAKFEYKADCFVTSEGEFTIQIHPDLLSIAYRMKPQNGVGINKARSDAAERVYCNDLKAGLAFLKACAVELLTAEEKTERVIVYEAEFNLSYWKQPDGRIFPNGYNEAGIIRPGQWQDLKFHNKGTNSTNRTNIFSLGICAAVFDKVTTIRKSGNVVRYISIRNLERNSPAAMLNSFASLDVNTRGVGQSYCRSQEMPYSDEAALFFHDVMLGLCSLAERIDTVIADKPKLFEAIQRGATKLLK